MAEEFKYKPEWDGPLSGPSFEKQTEDAINALHRRIDEYVKPIKPFDETPRGPTPLGNKGTVEEYARGDHQHPEQAFVDQTRALDHGVDVTLTLISASSDGSSYVDRGVIGSASTDFGGALFNINVNIPDAKAPDSGGSGGVNGLMTAEDKALVEAMNPYPRISAIAVSASNEQVENIPASAVLPTSAMVDLRIVGALGIKADVDASESAVTVSLGTDASAIAGNGLSVSEGVIGLDGDYFAGEDRAGLMSPEMYANLQQAFVGVSARTGALVFSSVDGNVTEVAVATSGGGGGGGGGDDEDEEPQIEAVEDVSLSYSFDPDAPARYAQETAQSIELRRHGVNFMNAETVLRNGVPFTLAFTTNEFTLSVSAQPLLIEETGGTTSVAPVPGIASAELFGNGLAVPGEAVSTVDDPAVFSASLDVKYAAPDEDHVDGPTEQYGTFTLVWMKTSEGTPDTYSLSITWHAPEGVEGAGMSLTSIKINGTEAAPSGGVALADGTPLVEAFDAPNQDEGAVALIVNAIPEELSGVLSAAVDVASSGDYQRPQITPGSIAIGDSASMTGTLYVTYEEPDAEHVNGRTDAYGTFNIVWERISDYDFSVSLEWVAPEGTPTAGPEAVLTVRQDMTTGKKKTAEVYMPDVASAIVKAEGVASNAAAISVLSGAVEAQNGKAVAGQTLSAECTVIPPQSELPLYFAITPASNVSGSSCYASAVSAYNAAISAYPYSGTDEEQENAIAGIDEALYAVRRTQTDVLAASWGDGRPPFPVDEAVAAGFFGAGQISSDTAELAVFAVVAASSDVTKTVTLSGIVSGDSTLYPAPDVVLAGWAVASSVAQHCEGGIAVSALPAASGTSSSWTISGNQDGSTIDVSLGYVPPVPPESEDDDGTPAQYPVTLDWTPTAGSIVTSARHAVIVSSVTTLADESEFTATVDITDAIASAFGITPAPVAP